MVYTLRFFFSSVCSLFHNSNVFGSCIIHILYTGCAKIKKNNSSAKRLNNVLCRGYIWYTRRFGGSTHLKPRAYQILTSQIMDHIERNYTGVFKDYDWMAACGSINSNHMTKRHQFKSWLFSCRLISKAAGGSWIHQLTFWRRNDFFF